MVIHKKEILILCHDPSPAWMSLTLTLCERTISSLPAGHVISGCLTERISVHDVN